LVLWLDLALLVCSAHSGVAAKVKFTYDAAGRLTAAAYGSNTVSTFAYDLNGNLLQRATTMPTNADVRLSKTSDFTGRTVGNPITYFLTVTNAGPDAAADVVVTDPLPFGVLFSEASVGQGSVSFANRTLTADLGVLAAGNDATVTIVMFHGLTNTATNIAMVSASTPDPNLANNTASRVTSGLGPINDSDGDGMPNWWETLYGLGGGSLFGANGDPDGDGVRNFDEWLADTLPQNAASFFHIETVSVEGNVTTLAFQSSPIRRYHAQFAPDLNTAFTNFLSFNGTGLMMSVLHTNGSSGFYRLVAEVP